MAKLLTPFSVVAPGSYGLNTKLSGLEIGPQWCLSARNCVLSDQGTVAARKGWSTFPDVPARTGEPPVKAIYEYIDNSNTSRIIWAANNKIFEGTSTVSIVTSVEASTTDDHWKFVNFNGKVVGVQAGHDPIVKVDEGDFEKIVFDTDPSDPVDALAAWGRVWYVEGDRQTIKYTDLLQEGVLNSGSSGLINMYTVWSNGTDEIVGIQEFNNYLAIFGRQQIILYSGAEDPNNALQLVDIISNTGCIARDSIQNIGQDILFLGEEGVISLARNVEAGGNVRSLPLANLTENVSDFLAKFSLTELAKDIKSCYKPDDGFYLICFPTSGITFYVNTRYQTPDKKARVFVWYDINPTSLFVDRKDNLYLGQNGYLGLYDGYSDNGDEYNMSIKTGWISGEGEIGTSKKIFKQAVLTVVGGYGNKFTLSWGFDFIPSAYDSQNVVSTSDISPSEYGINEYGTAKYSRLTLVNPLSYQMTGNGRSLQLGISTEIVGSPVNLQKIDIFLKGGKISRRGK